MKIEMAKGCWRRAAAERESHRRRSLRSGWHRRRRHGKLYEDAAPPLAELDALGIKDRRDVLTEAELTKAVTDAACRRTASLPRTAVFERRGSRSSDLMMNDPDEAMLLTSLDPAA
jgi:hypothetical protein